MINKEENDLIVAAIHTAEQQTSGEIRVHIDKKCSTDPVKRAVQVFEKLGMHKTALRNGVLIYVSFSDRKLAIIGDQGIDAVVPADFWVSTKDQMIHCFKENQQKVDISKVRMLLTLWSRLTRIRVLGYFLLITPKRT